METSERNIKLFTYGTLKRGRGNYRYFLRNAKFLGEATTNKDYSLVVYSLPYMIERKGTGVKGELFEINEQELDAIDGLEGHPSFYQRKTITVTDDQGNETETFAYLHPDKFSEEVELREEF